MKKVSLLLFLLSFSLGGLFAQMQKLLPSNPSGDRAKFGQSVTISGNLVAVGATDDDQLINNNGAVYLFEENGGNWTQLAKVFPNTGSSFSEFGVYTAIFGNLLAVGNTNVLDGGSVFIFQRNGNTWTQVARVTPPNGSESTFGSSVALGSDYLAVGAKNENRSASVLQAGAVYMYSYSGTSFTFQAKLEADTPIQNGFFGGSLHSDGNRVIIGCQGDNRTGAAYVYRKDGSSWVKEARLTGNDSAADDLFGTSVFIDGDYAIAGAIWDDDNGNESGSAYIFQRNGTSWSQQAKLLATDGDDADNFGTGSALLGDWAVVSAPTDEQGGPFSGSAYLFRRSGNNWVADSKVASTDPNQNEGFGRVVDADSGTVIFGANGDNQNGDFSGAAFVLPISTSGNADVRNLAAGISLFPNPASDNIQVRIQVELNQEQADYRILDLSGRVLGRGQINTLDTQMVKLPEIPEGQYLLELEIGQLKLAKPFLKKN